MNHSPGPWNIAPRIHYHMFAAIMGADGQLVVNLGDGGNGIEKQTGNAFLVAAAPLMHEFIKSKAEKGDPEAEKLLELADGRTLVDCAVCGQSYQRRALAPNYRYVPWMLCEACASKKTIGEETKSQS